MTSAETALLDHVSKLFVVDLHPTAATRAAAPTSTCLIMASMIAAFLATRHRRNYSDSFRDDV
jgi:hypothetical protein